MTFNIIALSGYRRSGKDTVADYLVDHYDFHKLSFADPIRAALHTMLDVDDSYIAGSRRNEIIPMYNVDYRQAMITLGTAWGRNMISSEIWNIKMSETIRNLHKDGIRRVVITDVRFADEDQYVRKLGAVRWHIQRDKYPPPSMLKHHLFIKRVHKSDRPLPIKDGDIVVRNSCGIQNLQNIITEQMQK